MTDRETPRRTAADFHPEVLKLFDKYVHGAIDRRGFLDGAARFAVGGVTAAGLLEALSPNFAAAQQVPKTDARIKAETVDFPSPQGYGTGRGYLVRPASAPPAGSTTTGLPLVLVVHENRGLNPHIEDIARRLALDNFIAFAPDALFPLGGYPGNEDQARELFGKLDQAKTREDFVAAAAYLKGVPGGNGKLGAVGFCWGGGMVNTLATRLPDLNADRALLRAGAGDRPGAEDQGGGAADVRRRGRAHQRHLAGLRRGPQGRGGALRRVPLSGNAARLQQRHDPALRRQRRQAGLAAHARLLQPGVAPLSTRGARGRDRRRRSVDLAVLVLAC